MRRRCDQTQDTATDLPLPWSQIRVAARPGDLLTHVRSAVTKYSAGDSCRLFDLRVDVAVASASSRRDAARLFTHPTTCYQFVRGTEGLDESRYATADGSLARVRHADGMVELRLSPEVFTAPFSTWQDLFAAPLAEHWRTAGCVPLHAAAVTRGDVSTLVVGPSGSGKTTTAFALLLGPATWRADDKVLLRLEGSRPHAISLYRNANLAPATIAAFPQLTFAATRPPLDETNDKRACWLAEVSLPVDLATFEPTSLLFTQRGDSPNSRLSRLSPTEALLRLTAQSPRSGLRPRAAAQHHALCTLAATLPAFALEAGSDVLDRPAAFADRVFRTLAGVGRPR